MTVTKTYEGTGSAIDDYFKPPKSREAKANSENWAIFNKANQQHRAILSLMRQAQWTVPDDKWGEVADLKRLNTFLKSDKSPIKKPLKQMSTAELSKIIIALEGIVKSKYK